MHARSERALVATLILTAGLVCSACGDEPTAPRDVTPIERDPAPSNVTKQRDRDAPSRGLPCAEQQGAEVRLCGSATDNYKASFNANPDAGERRTWLAVHELELGDEPERWRADEDTPLTTQELRLVRDDGEPGARVATLAVVSGPGSAVLWRNGPQLGLWGVLLTTRGPDALRSVPIVVRVIVRDEAGEQVWKTEVDYRFDDELADAPTSSLEHRGPGGRWYVAGQATATNLELGWQ